MDGVVFEVDDALPHAFEPEVELVQVLDARDDPEGFQVVNINRVPFGDTVASGQGEDFGEHDNAWRVGWVADFQVKEAIWSWGGGGVASMTAPSSSATGGASSERGSEVEMAKLRRVGMLLTAATVTTTFPFTSCMRMVMGQMMSRESPREPAKTASVPLVVGNGQERTVNWAARPGTSMRKAIWFTSPLSQSLARRASAGNTLEKVLAMVAALDGSGLLYASAKLLSLASHAAW